MLNVLYEKKKWIYYLNLVYYSFFYVICYFNFMIIIILIKNVFEYKFNKNY